MDNRQNPENISALLADIEREYSLLMATLERSNPAQLDDSGAGGWSPKDHLAHLCEWMKSLLGYHLDRLPWHVVLEVDAQLTRDLDFDGINAILFERNRWRSYADVLAEFQSIYVKVISRLEIAPFEKLLEPRFPDDPRKRPLLNWVIANTSDHFAKHRETIEADVRQFD